MKDRCGCFAVSKAGHDKGKTYIIYALDGEYVYLVNGGTKTIDSPKKKKLLHIQIAYSIDHKIKEKLSNHTTITDDDVKEAIERYLTR